jgi:O-antigen ligase
MGGYRIGRPATAALPPLMLGLGWLVAFNVRGALALMALALVCLGIWLASEATARGPASVVLGALLIGMVAVGKPFAVIPIGPLYVSDAILALVALWLILRVALGGTGDRLRLPRGAWGFLLAYMAWGVVSVVYGHTHGGDLYFTARDAVVVAYAPVALLVVVLFPTRRDVGWLLRALYWSSLALTGIYLLRNQIGWQGPNHALGLQMAFFFIPVITRYTAGERVRRWEWLVLELQVAIPITLGTRTAWTALFVSLLFLMITARRRFAVWLTLGVASAALVFVTIVAPATTEPIQQEAASFAGRGSPRSDGNAAANASWRGEFWKHDLRVAVHHPLTGIGFGPPSNFCFSGNGECWDTRLTHDAAQISGPHNGFVDVFYRMGLPGLLLLLGLLGTAVRAGIRALPDPAARTSLALLLFAATTAFFSVALEGPYMGIPFWALVGMLWVCGRPESPRR